MKNKIIALTIAGTISFSNMVPVYAANLNEISKDRVEENKLKDGKYKVENDAFHITEDKESMARKFLEKESTIKVEKGQAKLAITFSNKSMMKNVKIKVNDKVIEAKTIDETDTTITYEFNINSIKDNIVVSATPFPTMSVDFRLILKEDTLKKEVDLTKPEEDTEEKENDKEDNKEEDKKEEDNKEDVEKPELDKKEDKDPEINGTTSNLPSTNKPQTNTGSNSGVTTKPNNTTNNISNSNNNLGSQIESSIQTQNKELYKMQNEILTESEIGYTAARGAIAKTNYMEVREGKKYVTMSISGTDLMSNIRVFVNNKSVNYTVLKDDKNNNLMDIEFLVGSLDDNINFKMHIDMLGEDIDFGVKFLKDTVTQIGFIPESQSNTELSVPNIESLSSIISDSSSESNLNSDEDTTSNTKKSTKSTKSNKSNTKSSKKSLAKKSYKEYTIKNEIVSDSAIGKKMSRKYLNETSLIEEIDGVKYITLRFSGTDLMNDIKIKVNDEDVEMELVDEDSEKNIVAYRFKIDTINDDIKVYAHIVPMNMDIDFGVKLLEDTLELVSEYTPEDVVVDGTKLKKTLATSFGGGMFLLGIGTNVFGTKMFRKIKSKKKE